VRGLAEQLRERLHAAHDSSGANSIAAGGERLSHKDGGLPISA
jgi:hypothetical protein